MYIKGQQDNTKIYYNAFMYINTHSHGPIDRYTHEWWVPADTDSEGGATAETPNQRRV